MARRSIYVEEYVPKGKVEVLFSRKHFPEILLKKNQQSTHKQSSIINFGQIYVLSAV